MNQVAPKTKTSAAADAPSVSVVIPAFNAEPYLSECLDSVVAQRGVQAQIIVVDDGSTDRTREVAARYGRRVEYLYQPNSGGCSAPRNAGARRARGEFIAFLDADDVMAPGKLRAQAQLLRAHSGVGCWVSDYRNFGPQGPAAQSHFDTCRLLGAAFDAQGGAEALVLPPAQARAILARENFGIASAPMYRRNAFFALGGFDERLTASEDYDLLYRAALAGPLGLLRQVGFARRLHDGNMSRGAIRILEQKARSRAKLARLEPDAGLRALLEAAVGGYRTELVQELARQGRVAAAARQLAAGPTGLLASREAVWTVARCLAGCAARALGRRT